MVPNSELKVCIMGLGYIGLPTAAMLASRDIEVLGVDVVPHVVDTINKGEVHIVEPDLDMLVRAACQMKKLRASLKPEPADVFLITVPTPLHENKDGIPAPCIDYVLEATRAIAPVVKPGNLVICESTSPVGTTHQVARVLEECGVDLASVFIAYCPERVLPGRVITELVENDRVVGGINSESARKAKEFYRRFVKGKIFETRSDVAEMVKLSENSYRDVNIAFANELSIICDKLGINVHELIMLTNCHPRVNVLKPGCGVGGHCIAVDPWFIVHSDPENSRLIRTAREVNDYKTKWVIERVKSEYRKLKKDKPVVAILGLAFKPDIDDLRSSPAVTIAREVGRETDARFLFVEPNIETHPEFELTSFPFAVSEADVIVRLVAHSAFTEGGGLESVNKPILDFAAR